MEIVFLGTSCMVPTKERNHSALLLTYKNEGILVDCGEGTQRQLRIADIRPTRITKILISHWHGDHVLGLPGLLQTLSASRYSGILEIYGPAGTKKRFKAMFQAFVFDCNIELKITEIKKRKLFENEDFYLEALELEHKIKSFGFNFIEKDRRKVDIDAIKKLGIPQGPLVGKLQQGESIVFKNKKITSKEATYIEKGKKITIINDTVMCKSCYDLAKDADLLICEAAYTSKLEEKALEYKHLTAKQAALLAGKSNVKKLIITHFSQRYKTTEELFEDAKEAFDNVLCAYDFMKVEI
ncbi:MAG: ribonuclease Z [Candidatus Woesearchaeota archaeon]|nr:ribonuclease Z [Candidatus Woesearchaeota archaeon]